MRIRVLDAYLLGFAIQGLFRRLWITLFYRWQYQTAKSFWHIVLFYHRITQHFWNISSRQYECKSNTFFRKQPFRAQAEETGPNVVSYLLLFNSVRNTYVEGTFSAEILTASYYYHYKGCDHTTLRQNISTRHLNALSTCRP